MKSISPELQAHLALEVTTMTTCVRVARKDAQVFGFTALDKDLTFESTLYKAILGVEATAIDSRSALQTGSLEIRGMLDATFGIAEADVVSGVWDFADVLVFQVNYQDLTMGSIKQRRGWLGEVSVTHSFAVEMKGLAQKLQQTIIPLSKERCDADLFDSRCKVVPTENVTQFSGKTVTAVALAQREFTCTALGSLTAGLLSAGKVTWTSGANIGLSSEIKEHNGTTVKLFEATPYPIAPGDVFTALAGCQKRYAEDCIAKYNNGINFRGFPWLPGTDSTWEAP